MVVMLSVLAALAAEPSGQTAEPVAQEQVEGSVAVEELPPWGEPGKVKPKFIGIPAPSFSPQTDFGLAVIGMMSLPLQPEKVPKQPPSQTGVFLFGSTNLSFAGGVFQRLFLHGDKHRVRWAAGAAQFNADYYFQEIAPDLPSPVAPMGSFSFWTGAIDLYNVWNRLYIGGRVSYQYNRSRIFTDEEREEVGFEETTNNVAFGIQSEYDSRDDQFSAFRGVYGELKNSYFLEALGSTTNYVLLEVNFNGYVPVVNERWRFAGRVHYEEAFGTVPLYARPVFGSGADLRGFAYGEYRGGQLGARGTARVPRQCGLAASPRGVRWDRHRGRRGLEHAQGRAIPRLRRRRTPTPAVQGHAHGPSL